MKRLFVILIIPVLFINPAQVSSQERTSGFSFRNLFSRTQTETDTVFVNEYIDLSNQGEWNEAIEAFYQSRNFSLAWTDNNGSLNQNGEQLIEELEKAWQEGLPSEAARIQYIENSIVRKRRLSSWNNSFPARAAELDVFLTKTYFEYASALSTGIIDPAELDVIWTILPEEPDYVGLLEEAAAEGKIAESLNQLRPVHKQYGLLRDAYLRLLDVQSDGGWPLPGFHDTVTENDSASYVVKLKQYLQTTGDLEVNNQQYISSPLFDTELTEAIKRFQQRHGILDDGIPGENTQAIMNVPLSQRLNQVILNLERLRWLPDDLGENHIVINIPDFTFEYQREGEPVLEMNVVVGENEHYTPVLEDTLYSVIFNPSWNVPNSIATKEIFPKMLEDPDYMEENRYLVLKDSYVSKDTIDIHEFDWSEVSRDSFPFFIVQEPGPWNSLGQIQFMLENQYSIFLHDTPAGHLFDREQRDFSHGCVRLEKPEELALTLLQEQLPNDTIMKYISEDEKQVVRLDEKIPVHLIYQTAWIGEGNQIHFREDIYEFDRISLQYLQKRQPEFAAIETKK